MDILTACDDPKLFAPWFRDPETWKAWRSFLRALFALPMDQEALDIYKQRTARADPPTEPAKESWLVCGRRSGKSFICALVAVFLACFRSYAEHLTPGERGVVMIIASDRMQARVIMGYVRALLVENPMLARMVTGDRTEAIDLNNFISIEIHTCSFRAVRGRTVVAALLDEAAFWRSDQTSNPDREVLAAIRPSMLTIPNSLLIGLSSPYAKRGVLWENFKAHHGVDGDQILVWQAPTRTMNPTVPESVIADAYRDDPQMARSEYGAEFRDDISTFLPVELVEACVRDHPLELPPSDGFRYSAFVDPSGGRGDAMTMAIAHMDGGKIVVDCLKTVQPPFDPQRVVADFAKVLKDYKLATCTGDRYGSAWVSEAFKEKGVTYLPSRLAKSEIYLECLPQFSREAVELPSERRLVVEFANLERRTSRSGKDSVDHPARSHDDSANAVAGAIWICQTQGAQVYGSIVGAVADLYRPSPHAGLQ